MGVQHNAHVAARHLHLRGLAVGRELDDEVTIQAQLVARRMREIVAKFRTHLANSIHVEDRGKQVKFVAPAMDYAEAVEKGVKPGGKGLPRFFDPAAADAVAWLMTKLRGGKRAAKKGSTAFQKAELTLRDAYEGWAWHVRKFGVKAQPYVAPTAREMGAPVARALRNRLVAALRRFEYGRA